MRDLCHRDHEVLLQGHYERPPYQMDSMRSAYHIRELEVCRLKQLQKPLDVFLSHDWPRNIARHGDTQRLVRAKPFLRSEVSRSYSCARRELAPDWFAHVLPFALILAWLPE